MSNVLAKKTNNPLDIIDGNADILIDDQNDLTISADQLVLPKDFDDKIDNTQLSKQSAANIWKSIAAQWKCTDSDKFVEMKLSLIAYCCLNGTSDKLTGEITIAGVKHDIEDIFPIINSQKDATLRKFMRANAELAHAILSKNPDLAKRCARRKLMDKHYQSYACDFLDNMQTLTPGSGAHMELMKAKQRGLRLINDDYEQVRDKNDDAHQVPKVNPVVPSGRGRYA